MTREYTDADLWGRKKPGRTIDKAPLGPVHHLLGELIHGYGDHSLVKFKGLFGLRNYARKRPDIAVELRAYGGKYLKYTLPRATVEQWLDTRYPEWRQGFPVGDPDRERTEE